ncbi:neural proliferation differentiation and control protein 1 [Hemicordylus capensis]|uniref:neural proliferation differentiation and control protein 1 n=1 Tax=Hemicordylus capensis TaxID=884348 RepID=UPI00230261AE|nr:neural proliferation differentiation and control protein 1 [Hemicordylus capensis]
MSAAPCSLLLLLLPPLALLLLLLPPPARASPERQQTESCPRSLDCTLQRREFCLPGSHVCGPCLPQFAEDGHGKCIPKTRAPSGRTVPNLEDEIDFLADMLSRQEDAGQPKLQDGTPAPEGQHHKVGVPKAESLPRGRAGLPAATSRPFTPAEVESSRLSSNDTLILGLIVVCTIAGISALIVAAVCWCRLQKEIRLAQKVDYLAHNNFPGPPSYDKISPGDKKLAQSAQMYHYQHQKQQMLSMEKHKEEAKAPESASSDEENEDGDFTVYECPGLAPTGEMEVKNPLFDDSSLHPPLPNSHP